MRENLSSSCWHCLEQTFTIGIDKNSEKVHLNERCKQEVQLTLNVWEQELAKQKPESKETRSPSRYPDGCDLHNKPRNFKEVLKKERSEINRAVNKRFRIIWWVRKPVPRYIRSMTMWAKNIHIWPGAWNNIARPMLKRVREAHQWE